MSTPTGDYKKLLDELLANYVDGYRVFINNDWNQPPRFKPDARGYDLPDTWMGLMERVTAIIGKEKYNLDTYDNEIQILDVEQMIDMYVNNGMPYNFVHWSHGKERIKIERDVAEGRMNLALELVINMEPSISYCMTTNSKAEQALVIAHAAQGHNAFFKNNYMFTQFTKADEIRGDLKRFAEFVDECENKYGVAEVERILDACHALEMHAVDYRVRVKSKKTKKQQDAHKASIEVARAANTDAMLDAMSVNKVVGFKSVVNEDEKERPISEQNLLRFIAETAPHLKDWERKIINMFCDRAQYFYPQMRTKVMNEGFASFWHYKITTDMHELGLISDGMYLEILDSHAAIALRQPDFKRFNPYALGFAIFSDLERMSKAPTKEDYEWFPSIAGNSDWLSVVKEAAYNYHDESFMYQYLSPEVIRHFYMFAVEDDNSKKNMEVVAVHDDEGYKKIRSTLAGMYDLAAQIPQIDPLDYDYRGERGLILKHAVHNSKPLDKEAAQEVLKHVYRLWEHPVILISVEKDGTLKGSLSCPEPLQVSQRTANILGQFPAPPSFVPG